MLAVVTKRLALVKALSAACDALHALGATPLRVRQLGTVTEALSVARDAAFLVVDLACPQEDVVQDVTDWVTQNTSGRLILVGSHTDPELCGSLCFYLGRLAVGPLVSAAEGNNPEFWKEIILRHPFAQVMDALSTQLRDALDTRAGGRAIPNYRLIRTIFQLAPKNPAVSDVLRPDTPDGRCTKSLQNKVAQMLKDAGQASPSEFITVFRLLIYRHLKDAFYTSGKVQWRTSDIEGVLHQSLDALSRSLRQRTGKTIRELETITVEQLLRIITDMVVPTGERVDLKTALADAVYAAEQAGRRPSLGRSGSLRLIALLPCMFLLLTTGGDIDGDGVADVPKPHIVLVAKRARAPMKHRLRNAA